MNAVRPRGHVSSYLVSRITAYTDRSLGAFQGLGVGGDTKRNTSNRVLIYDYTQYIVVPLTSIYCNCWSVCDIGVARIFSGVHFSSPKKVTTFFSRRPSKQAETKLSTSTVQISPISLKKLDSCSA